jgi:hypothetical protein
MPTGHNSDIYRNDPPALIDAGPVITLRAAGALIFGKTTTTEFAAVVDGGPSMNPHDPSRTPGGSSSGSGAAVGDFQVPIGLGTQTGGSTIRPGSFNGIYAFKVCISTLLVTETLKFNTANLGGNLTRGADTVFHDLRYLGSLCTFCGRSRAPRQSLRTRRR